MLTANARTSHRDVAVHAWLCQAAGHVPSGQDKARTKRINQADFRHRERVDLLPRFLEFLEFIEFVKAERSLPL
jgi:hypothetical protein